MAKNVKTIGKCSYCTDPIYDFQEKVKVNGKLYHKGCSIIEQGQAVPTKK